MTSTPPEGQKRPVMRRSTSGSFFLGCFRPPVTDTRDVGLVRSRSCPLKAGDAERAVLAYIAFDDDDGKDPRVFTRVVPCGARERLVRATKEAFLEMSLVRKVRKKRHPRKMEEPGRQPCKKSARILRLMSGRTSSARDEPWEEPKERDFDVLTLTGSSVSATPSRDLSSNSLDCRSSKLPDRERPLSLVTSPLCLIPLALALLIVWGKVCAIVCISACLASSLTSWVARTGKEAVMVDSRNGDRKRVVMEGLLQRRHRHPGGRQRWST